MIDQNYVNSMNHWFKSMGYSIEQSISTIKYNKEQVKLIEKQIDSESGVLIANTERLNQSKILFQKYLDDNIGE